MPDVQPGQPLAAPTVYQEFLDRWADAAGRAASLGRYTGGGLSFVPDLLPEQALALTADEVLGILRARWGAAVDLAIGADASDPAQPLAALPAALRSPVAAQPDGRWLRATNMVGINVRTVGSFWGVVKYALTLAAAQDAIHLLPIWEPGVLGSIYGMRSWQLNPEFWSAELAAVAPHLATVERQLRAVVNLLHVMGKTVGMDVIPHTDRYSEIALAFPEHFEWLQRQDTLIISQRAALHTAVQGKIIEFLRLHGAAVGAPPATAAALFSADVAEDARLLTLFGPPDDPAGRQERRGALIAYLSSYGYEPLPATMAPPYRGLEVDPRPEASSVDAAGQVWREYRITNPTPMSRVFGPLGRYKLYEPLDDNRDWALDFARPRVAVWDYVCQRYAAVQQRYGFDFMRGDMSHVQMRPSGVPDQPDPRYDLLGAVKRYVQTVGGAPSFGYFAEGFLAPRDTMGYGEEIDHLEAAAADVVLGDLQSTVAGGAVFLGRLRLYADLLQTRQCAPAFTVMTADKDDPRFDGFYLRGNLLRLFCALLLTDMPSYQGLGFETRDRHDLPAPNEHYTKLYVFQETSGPKATSGPYRWGRNAVLYSAWTRLREFVDAKLVDAARPADALADRPRCHRRESGARLDAGRRRRVCLRRQHRRAGGRPPDAAAAGRCARAAVRLLNRRECIGHRPGADSAAGRTIRSRAWLPMNAVSTV